MRAFLIAINNTSLTNVYLFKNFDATIIKNKNQKHRYNNNQKQPTV